MVNSTEYLLSLSLAEYKRVRKAVRVLDGLGVKYGYVTVIDAHQKQRADRAEPSWAKHGLKKIREANIAAGIA